MMACHGVEPGCTVMGADSVCGGMWTVWAGAAVMESPSVDVEVASPWMVRRRWWRSAGSVQVSLGSLLRARSQFVALKTGDKTPAAHKK